jgi:hypothetical protein
MVKKENEEFILITSLNDGSFAIGLFNLTSTEVPPHGLVLFESVRKNSVRGSRERGRVCVIW